MKKERCLFDKIGLRSAEISTRYEIAVMNAGRLAPEIDLDKAPSVGRSGHSAGDCRHGLACREVIDDKEVAWRIRT